MNTNICSIDDSLEDLKSNSGSASLEWKLVGSASGNTQNIILPNNFKEIKINILGNKICVTSIVSRIELENELIAYINGWYYQASDCGKVQFVCSLQSCNLSYFILNGSDITSSTLIHVYYR